IPLLIVFQYKNRKRQVLYIMIEIALIVLLGIWMWSTANNTLGVISQSVRAGNIGVGFFLLPIAIIFLGMAIGGIRKDEKLIKSADRLRSETGGLCCLYLFVSCCPAVLLHRNKTNIP